MCGSSFFKFLWPTLFLFTFSHLLLFFCVFFSLWYHLFSYLFIFLLQTSKQIRLVALSLTDCECPSAKRAVPSVAIMAAVMSFEPMVLMFHVRSFAYWWTHAGQVEVMCNYRAATSSLFRIHQCVNIVAIHSHATVTVITNCIIDYTVIFKCLNSCSSPYTGYFRN